MEAVWRFQASLHLQANNFYKPLPFLSLESMGLYEEDNLMPKGETKIIARYRKESSAE